MSGQTRAICVSSSAGGRSLRRYDFFAHTWIFFPGLAVGIWSCKMLWTMLCSIVSHPLPPSVISLRFLVPPIIYGFHNHVLRLYQIVVVYRYRFKKVVDCGNNGRLSLSLHHVHTVNNFCYGLPTAMQLFVVMTTTIDHNGTPSLKTVRPVPSSSTSSVSSLYPLRRGR